MAGTYVAVGLQEYEAAAFSAGEVTLSDELVVEVASVERTYLGTARITFNALADGSATAVFSADKSSETWQLEVRDGAIIEGGVNFTGWEAVLVSLCVFLAVASLLFGSIFFKLRRASRYGYAMIASCGGMLFCLFQFAFFTWLFLFEGTPSLSTFVYDVCNMVDLFDAATLAPMALLALLVTLSNLALIRHEGLRPVNLLGIAASIIWAVATMLWVFLDAGFAGSHGANPGPRYLNLLITVAIAYGESLLLATILCAWLASRHQPDANPDYLIILGCGIRADGTPCPLLAGRVDRAASFDAAKVAAGDAPAVFVPSGGQGPDEPTSEALSMANYLAEQRGIDRTRIVLEDRSSTTRENMRFSREAIERHSGQDAARLRIAFSTTNYHVFRGYVCAEEAGMTVEGMGSKTKYYFWPNAFLREFVGLLAAQWKAVLQTYAVIAAIYILAELILMSS